MHQAAPENVNPGSPKSISVACSAILVQNPKYFTDTCLKWMYESVRVWCPQRQSAHTLIEMVEMNAGFEVTTQAQCMGVLPATEFSGSADRDHVVAIVLEACVHDASVAVVSQVSHSTDLMQASACLPFNVCGRSSWYP